MDKNLSYVQMHFMPSCSLIERSGVSADVLAELVANRMLPRPAYFRNEHGKLASNLGSTDVSLDDDYFHSAAIAQARHAAALLTAGAAPLAIADALKSNFISVYMEHLTELEQFDLVEKRVWQEHFADPESRRTLAEKEYGHWIAGTYALCTRDNTAQAVAVKECWYRTWMRSRTRERVTIFRQTRSPGSRNT